MKKRRFAVIGIGKFGENIAKQLHTLGENVLAIDLIEDRVNDIAQFVTNAVQADATDERALEALDLKNYDVAIVAVRSLQASILITMRCKEIGVKFVLARAENELHKKILERTGADKVVIPERDMGFRIAHSLVTSDILEYIELAGDLRIIEIITLDEWIGHNLNDLDLRRKYAVNIIAVIKANGDINMLPAGEDTISQSDLLVAIGSKESIDKISKFMK